MNFDVSLLRRLSAAPEIFRQIQDWRGAELALQERLRTAFPDDLVRGALSLCELRARAAEKFSRSDQMWFDRVSLEQSTSEPVARHKAKRFHGPSPVWDYCCGIGADAIALAERTHVIAVDRDPAACLCAKWNAQAYGVAGRVSVVCADVETLADRGGLVHIDPDRRSAAAVPHADRSRARRSLRLEAGSPGLAFLQRLTAEFAGGAIKASPAANFGGKFPAAEVELVSLAGECKEATIWFGELARPGTWRATVLPSGETLAGDPLSAIAPVGPLESHLFDPDPALVRAGLIDLFAAQTGLKRLDDQEEFLTGSRRVCSPFVRGFEVAANLPNNSRAIRGYFRHAGIGRVEIKCRRIPLDVEAVRRSLPLWGPQAAVLIFARIAGRARAVVCRRDDP